MSKSTSAIAAVPYPEPPYQITALATFASGSQRGLVFWGAQCSFSDSESDLGSTVIGQCRSTETYLDAGVARCASHLTEACKHGSVLCHECGPIVPRVGASVSAVPQ